MTKNQISKKNPNILTWEEVDEMGIEEATEDMGLSLDEIENALKAKEEADGQEKGGDHRN